MTLEVIAAVTLGALLLWLALGSLGQAPSELDHGEFDPIEDTPRGQALIALKELDFDRETGKIAEDDYRDLKAKLSREALRAIARDAAAEGRDAGTPDAPVATAQAGPPVCARCGPRPEADAVFCSRCGAPVGHRAA
ncbi:MAG: hypothetical protein AB7L66_11675 [Gemmatimonadales bacterium]